MKLVFPNGEHGSVELKEDVTITVGNAGWDITLTQSGIESRHCEILLRDGQVVLKALANGASVFVNGKPVTGESIAKAGDLLSFSGVSCRLVGVDARKAESPAAKKMTTEELEGHTRVRTNLPKYTLRGVAGPTFGKSFTLTGAMILGRQQDCDICIPSEEISRQHAKLKVVPAGIMVEDLGSANGTFINDKRVQGSELLKPGEELRLDTVRFLLVAPGMDAQQQAASSSRLSDIPTIPEKSNARLWIMVGLIAVIAAAMAVWGLMGKS